MDIKKLLKRENPIAIVGASNNPGKYGYKIFNDLKSAGYKVYPINIKEKEVIGVKAFGTLDELVSTGVKPTIVNFVVPPQISRKIVDDCKRLGLLNVWFQPGSFDDKLIRYCDEIGLNSEHKECIMVARQNKGD